jgi:hypothetical protein
MISFRIFGDGAEEGAGAMVAAGSVGWVWLSKKIKSLVELGRGCLTAFW